MLCVRVRENEPSKCDQTVTLIFKLTFYRSTLDAFIFIFQYNVMMVNLRIYKQSGKSHKCIFVNRRAIKKKIIIQKSSLFEVTIRREVSCKFDLGG